MRFKSKPLLLDGKLCHQVFQAAFNRTRILTKASESAGLCALRSLFLPSLTPGMAASPHWLLLLLRQLEEGRLPLPPSPPLCQRWILASKAKTAPCLLRGSQASKYPASQEDCAPQHLEGHKEG